jgi:hypothetical protein
LETFEAVNLLQCQLKSDDRKCPEKFVKAQAPCFYMGKWFCSEQCVDEDLDVKEMSKIQEGKNASSATGATVDDPESEEVEIDL